MSGDDSNYTMVRKNSKKDKEISYHILNESIVLKGESEFLNRMSNFVQNKYQKLVTLMYINICKKSLKHMYINICKKKFKSFPLVNGV